jgi:hypothetical protein
VESQGQLKQQSQVELPSYVEGGFDVFVNGVPQARGLDYDQDGRMLVFRSENDTVDIVFTRNGRRTVESLHAVPVPAASPASSE